MSGTTYFVRNHTGATRERDTAIPRFHLESVEDQRASSLAGRPIYRDEERIEIIFPGDPLKRFVSVVTKEFTDRWPEEYEAFKRGEARAREGTPIDQWSYLRPRNVRELKALEIYTVEDCAALTDVAIQRIGLGGRQIREAAIAYLDDAAAAAMNTKLERENDELRSQMGALQRQMEEQSALITQMHQQMMLAANAPHPLATNVPASNYQFQEPSIPVPSAGAPVASSLDDLPPPVRRRGRPTNEEIAARRAAAAQEEV